MFYQVYPRSFQDSDGDGVGDLVGLIARLPYIAELGVDAIWLSPVFASPMKDFGYDVSDYCAIDPLFGTLADFDRLIDAAHRLGLRLIIDQVWSHTSDQHPWFADSVQRLASRENWYVWADAKADGSPPNNWQASFGGPAWTWHPVRRQYYLHNFLSSQPDLNFHCAPVQDAILDVARFWLDRGIDGFRLDVINYIAHNRALTDNPPRQLNEIPAQTIRFQRQLHNKSQPEALVFVGRLRSLLDSYGDRMVVGEIFDDDMLGRQREYTDGPERLHTAYSFYLLNAARADPMLFTSAVDAWAGASGWPSWSLGNHDVPRFPTRLAHDDQRLTRALIALLLCLPGTPFLYQGEELGLEQAQVPFAALRDPFSLASYTGGSGRDGARTPMPWSTDAPGGGFTTGEPWLPLDPRHLARSVAAQSIDPGSTLAWTRRWLKLRRAHPALQTGSARVVAAPPGVFAIERADSRGVLLAAFNLKPEPATLEDPRLATANPLVGPPPIGAQLVIPGHGAVLLALP